VAQFGMALGTTHGSELMPSKSQAQHRLMEAIAHGAKPKKGKGPSRKVAREYVAADEMKRRARKVFGK